MRSNKILSQWKSCNPKGGRDSVVGIATRYGLECPGIESWWGEIFRTRPDRPWMPPTQRVPSILPESKASTRGLDHRPPSSAEVKERVEICLYSSSGPSWPILGWPLPFTFITQNAVHKIASVVLRIYLFVPLPCLTIYGFMKNRSRPYYGFKSARFCVRWSFLGFCVWFPSQEILFLFILLFFYFFLKSKNLQLSSNNYNYNYNYLLSPLCMLFTDYIPEENLVCRVCSAAAFL